MRFRLAIAAGLVTVIVGCSSSDAYTLYRDSVTSGGTAMRIHVASFDSADGDAYNRENCDIVRKLFSEQPDVKVRYWCEKGRGARR
jgi:hypothetical protein